MDRDRPTRARESPPVGTPWVRTLDGGGGQQLFEVVAWRGGFVARGSVMLWRPPGVGRQTIWTSPDGLAWTEVPDPFGPQRSPLVVVQRLVPFGDLLVAVGPQGRRLLVWTSRDGRHWQRVPDAPVFSSGGVPSHHGYELGISGAAATQGRIEIVGTYWLVTGPTYTRIWTSTDGRHWRRDAWTGADPTNLTDLSASTDRFTALVGPRNAETGDWVPLAATSPDGRAWTVLGSAPTEHAARIAWSREHAAYLVAGGLDLGQQMDILLGEPTDVGAPSVWSSPDGVTWTLRAQGPADSRLGETFLLVDGPAVLLSGMANGAPPDDDPWRWTMTSTDLSTWELSTAWQAMGVGLGCMDPMWFAMAGGRTVAVGGCPDDTAHVRAAAWVQGASAEAVAAARTRGPLAVVGDPGIGGLDAGNGPGRLVITDRCVYLKGSRWEGDTLVFRSGQTRWDAKRQQIVSRDRDLGEIWLSNGDRLELGGYGMGTAEPPDNVEVPIGPWIREPDASCPARRWVAEQVVPQGH